MLTVSILNCLVTLSPLPSSCYSNVHSGQTSTTPTGSEREETQSANTQETRLSEEDSCAKRQLHFFYRNLMG